VCKIFPYSWVAIYLFYIVPNNIMRRYIREDEVFYILKAFRDEPYEGNFAEKRKTLKIITIEYY
jgi:hypothetical protein